MKRSKDIVTEFKGRSTEIRVRPLSFREFVQAKNLDPRDCIDEYMDYVRIPEDTRDRLMKDYSHGTRNKMQMLVNIIAAPRLMLLDEPLTSLDVVVAEEMKDILRSQKEGRVLIFSTHLLDIALDLCDEIVLLNHGKLEVVDKNNLDNENFKTKIIEALKDADNT